MIENSWNFHTVHLLHNCAHSVETQEIYSHWKKILREINFLVTSSFQEIFVKNVSVNLRNFHTFIKTKKWCITEENFSNDGLLLVKEQIASLTSQPSVSLCSVAKYFSFFANNHLVNYLDFDSWIC